MITFVLQTCSWAPGAGWELQELSALITMFCHCLVIYTLKTLKSNWALFISTIIWSGLIKSEPLNSGSFWLVEKQKSCKLALTPGWLQLFGNLGCYLLSVLHKCICNLRVQLEAFVSAPYIILGFMEKIEPSSTSRGNSRVSLLTDMSWKLASYFGRDPEFFSFFPTTL